MLSTEERIEAEVRRRLRAALKGKGWSDEAVAKEVLYFLPGEFVRWYGELYLRGVVGDRALGAKSGAGQRPTGDEAEVKARVAGKWKGRRVGAGTGGAGSRYVEGARVILDEEAMKVRGQVDAFLLRMVWSGGRLTDEKVGQVIEVERGNGANGGRRKRRVCDECGKFMKDEWLRCPFHEA